MFDFMPQTGALPGGILERDSDRRILCGREDLIETRDNSLKTGGFTSTQVSAWMQHQEGQMQRGGKLDFLDQRLYRAVAIFTGRASQVNQVTAMAKDRMNSISS